MTTRAPSSPDAFRHEALFYSGEDDFLAGTVPFIRDAVTANEPVLVAVSAAKAGRIRAELNGEAEAVLFVDMLELGRNPNCIIPAWREFVGRHLREGAPVRGIGEPIWPGRGEDELVECQRHEWLLNLAFGDSPAWWLMCPYDVERLDPEVLRAAYLTHPYVAAHGHSHASGIYCNPSDSADPFIGPLPPPRAEPERLHFTLDELPDVRRLVAERAAAAGLDEARTGDLLIAVNEVATNSLRHAGGEGTASLWQEDGTLLCEIHDHGLLDDPLVGRERPAPEWITGRGLWMTNQLCDLVQIRSLPGGNVVRLQMDLR